MITDCKFETMHCLVINRAYSKFFGMNMIFISSCEAKNNIFLLFVCFVALRPNSTAMVIAGQTVHLTTLCPMQV